MTPKTSTPKTSIAKLTFLHWLVLSLMLLLLPTDGSTGIQAQGNCTQSGTDAACRGEGSQALGNISTAIGSLTTACNGNSSAFGLKTMVENDNSFVVGKFNVIANDDEVCSELEIQGQEPLFAVGIGLGPNGPTGERRKNALTVLDNGSTIIGTIRNGNSNIGPLSTLNVVGNAYVDRDLRLGDPGVFQIDDQNVAGGRFVVLSNGNVGIGTADPDETVEVMGTLKVSRHPLPYRGMNIWVATALNQTSCASACERGVCLVAYADDPKVVQKSCDAVSPNKNCLCVGRP